MSRAFVCMLFLGASVAAPVASATVVMNWSVDEMARRSHRVVHARVEDSRTTWTEGRRQIVTYTHFAVIDALKGPSEAVTLRQVGGAIDGLETRVAGDARFAPGEEVILFLERGPESNTSVLIAMRAARFSVVAGPKGKRVVRDLEGIAFGVSRPGEKFSVVAPELVQNHGTLAEFKAAVRRALLR